MLHHHPQIQFVNLREDNYQLINSDNIDNSPEILSKISKMNQAELAKLGVADFGYDRGKVRFL